MILLLAGILVAYTLVLRGVFEYVPWGAVGVPYLAASRKGPALQSPDGQYTVEVVYNDAGAAHSGNHWTWIVVYDPLLGRRVVAEGYMEPEVAVLGKPVPLWWEDGRTFRVEFLDKRGKGTTRSIRVRL